MKNFFKNPCNIYIMLLILYSIQGSFIPTGGTIYSQLILFITILMSLFFTVKTIVMNNKPVYFRGLNILLLTFTVYGVILLFSEHHYEIQSKLFDNNVSRYSYLKSIFMSLPNIYTFYYFSRKSYLTKSLLKKWVIVFFCTSVYQFFDYQQSTLKLLQLYGSDAEEITNNMGYLFTTLIPTVAIFNKKIRLQYSLLIICMVFIVIGLKRGAIITGTISIIYYLYFNYKYNRNISREKVVIFSFLIIITGYFLVEYMMETSDYFRARIHATKSGYSSGRDELYSHFWTHFTNETNLFKYLFGNGANATLKIGVNYAHNDWLEIAINQGLVGLIVYAYYWICLFNTVTASRQNKTALLILSLIMLSFLIKTFFSMSYTEYSMITCSVFGYYLAHYNNQI